MIQETEDHVMCYPVISVPALFWLAVFYQSVTSATVIETQVYLT